MELVRPVVGDVVSQNFTGTVKFNDVSVSATGLPNSVSTKLPAGVPVSVPYQLPLNGSFYPQWIVPTETNSITASQTSTAPAMFDIEPYNGDPDLASSSLGPGPLCSDNAAVSYSAKDRTVTAGTWYVAPTLCGPYTGPPPPASATITVTASTLAFDATVTSTTGDFWRPSGPSFTPLTLNSGQAGTINVTITPAGKSGTVIQGDLYVNTYVFATAPYLFLSAGDELAALPYAYTIQ